MRGMEGLLTFASNHGNTHSCCCIVSLIPVVYSACDRQLQSTLTLACVVKVIQAWSMRNVYFVMAVV